MPMNINSGNGKMTSLKLGGRTRPRPLKPEQSQVNTTDSVHKWEVSEGSCPFTVQVKWLSGDNGIHWRYMTVKGKCHRGKMQKMC